MSLYALMGPPGILTPHIDAPQLGFGLEKPFLTPCESDAKMTRTAAKYRGDRFRPKVFNFLDPKTSSSVQQYFPTSYAIPCTSSVQPSEQTSVQPSVQPAMDMSIQPQCATCLRLLPKSSTSCILQNNQWPNGAIADIAVNTSPQCQASTSLALNQCGVQCGHTVNTNSTSVSGWPSNVVNRLSM